MLFSSLLEGDTADANPDTILAPCAIPLPPPPTLSQSRGRSKAGHLFLGASLSLEEQELVLK